MNLPAVMLFICFSTAYGLKCKVGSATDEIDGEIRTVPCPTSTICGRLEMTKGSEWVTIYFCGSDFKTACDGKVSKDMCGKILPQCDKGKGCHDEKTKGDDGKTTVKKLCCSTDPEFSGMSSLFGPNWGLIIGIGVGVLAFFILLCLISALIAIYCCTSRRSVDREDRETTERHRHTHKSRPQKPQKSYVASQQAYQQPRPSIVTM